MTRYMFAIGAAALISAGARAQTDAFVQTVGMDTVRTFTHTSVPGATGIDFSLTCAISPTYPEPESHTIVFVFEWGPSLTGPWLTSPDYVNSVPAARTDFFATGVFHATGDAAFVRLHMYAGGIMVVSGEFTHTSVPTPAGAGVLLGAGAIMCVRRRR